MASSIGGLESTVKTLTRQWRDQDEKASLGRRDLHQKIDRDASTRCSSSRAGSRPRSTTSPT
jgi:hypothetical protein